jgi:hypothetical protein
MLISISPYESDYNMSLRTHRLWLSMALVLLLSLGVMNAVLADDASWSGEITTADPIWTWYYEADGGIYYFDVCVFSVDTDGEYTIEMIGGSLEDPDFTLSLAPFTPSSDAEDIGVGGTYLAYAYFNGGSIVLTHELEAGVKYSLTTSTRNHEVTGTYTNRISGPGNISLNCGGDSGAAGGPGPIAGNLLDGRINNSSATDVAAPAVVYCTEDGGFDVYAVDPVSGDGTLVARVTGDDITAMTPLTGAYEVLGGGAGVTLYRLATGGYQVNAVTTDGKLYEFAWDACPPTS